MKNSICRKLHVIIAWITASLILIAAASLIQMRQSMVTTHQETARAVVESALSILGTHHDAATSGRISPPLAQAQALDQLRRLRYDGDNYVWVNDSAPVLLMHPTHGDLEGQNVGQFQDSEGKAIFADFAALTQAQGSGFMSYYWPKPGTDTPQEKTSFVALFEPWGWVVGTGIYIDDVNRLFFERAAGFGVFLLIVVSGASFLALTMARRISVPLARITDLTVRLSQGETDIDIPTPKGDCEIAAMARALKVFKDEAQETRIARTVFETTSEAIVVTDATARIRAVNPAFQRITGYREEEVRGHNPSMLSSGRHDEEFYRQMWLSVARRGHWQGEVWNRRKDGALYAEWLTVTAITGKDGRVAGYVGVFSDVTSRAKAMEKVRHEADIDVLTDLPNRRTLMRRLDEIGKAALADNHQFALLFVDLDRFKPVNDGLGHDVGDQLLVQVARRLAACVRGSDMVARFGGDEFAIVVDRIDTEQDGATVAAKIVETISAPFHIGPHRISISASVGIARFPGDGKDVETVIKQADTAMYLAKTAGRSCFVEAGRTASSAA